MQTGRQVFVKLIFYLLSYAKITSLVSKNNKTTFKFPTKCEITKGNRKTFMTQ